MSQRKIRKTDVDLIRMTYQMAAKANDVVIHTFKFDGGEYVYKAYSPSSGTAIVSELVSVSLGRTVFHNTQSPMLYVDSTMHSITTVVLALLEVMNNNGMII